MEDIIRILDRVFNERCGFRVKVDVEYREPKESVSMEKSEAELQQRISFLSENLRKEKAAKAEAKAEAKAAREEKKAEKLVADRRAALPAMVEALAEAAREDPSVLAEATAEAITRMYSMEEILKMNRSRWNRCRKRWEKSLSKARSSMWKNGRSVESVRSLQ